MKRILLLSATAIALLWTLRTRFPPTCTHMETTALALVSPPVFEADTIAPNAVGVPEQAPQRVLNYPAVGKLKLYGNLSHPSTMVLFLSGDGGWNNAVTDMAKAITQDGQTLVVGIDIVKYYKKLQTSTEKCFYPAGDMENVSEFVQKELQLPHYLKPVLTGYSSGATLTYALLCQAPVGTFQGGIVLGFCPDVQLDKPLCEGSGKLTMTHRKDGKGFDFTTGIAPAVPLEVLHGELDQNCDCQKTCDFFQHTAKVNVARMPKIGHGFSVVKNWLPQYQKSLAHILAVAEHPTGAGSPNRVPIATASLGTAAVTGNTDLPLSITPTLPDNAAPMVFFLSGDGGWTSFDQQICDQLAAKHLPTVGLNCQSYFWKKKTPEQTVADLAPVIRQYLQTWNKSKFLLVGYSFGANVAPFFEQYLPADLRNKVQYMVLLAPDTKGDFEIHIAGMLGNGGGPYDVAAALRNLTGIPVLCISGDQEGDDMQHALKGVSHVRFEKIPGSHHFNNDALKVADRILSTKT